ncbi:MAG TPA: arsenate reductase (glutaredoxin) [Salinimicrobium sp.]|nr:arsenate reductase (glutaredoxin) [Salinimicrobium sp.]
MKTIFHNPRCSKSREGLNFLKESGEKFEIKEYLKEPLSEGELKELLEKLNMSPIELIRTNEKIWQEEYKNKDLDDAELIRVMLKHPQLIQRPIVADKDNAVIARPASRIKNLPD